MAALGITTFVPAAGATIMLTRDSEPLVVESEPGAAAALAQGELPQVDIAPEALDAFFGAGFDYDDAADLAEYWGMPTAYDAKVTKGKVLLGLIDFPAQAGRTLVDQALDAYFDAGYDYDHAAYLADYWGYDAPYDAKVTKGKVLLGEIDFPAEVGTEVPEETFEQFIDRSLDAYFEAGYDNDHAVDLAEFWGLDDPYDAKVYKGKFLIGAIDFPEENAFAPEEVTEEAETPTPTTGTIPPTTAKKESDPVVDEPETTATTVDVVDQALDAYFESYDYDHAVQLANFWGLDRPYDAKIIKGKFMLGLRSFPDEGAFGPTTPTTAPTTTTPTGNVVDQALDAYFEYYDYDHAVQLANFWGLDRPYDAKVVKGKFMLGLRSFPDEGAFGPTTPTTVGVIDQALNAYFDAGYDYDHAVDLAEAWGSASTPYEAKILKGKYLLGLIGFPG